MTMAYFLLPHVKTHSFYSLTPNSKIFATHQPLISHNNNLQIPGSYGYNGKRCTVLMKCAKGGSFLEIDRKLEDKNNMDIADQELANIGRLADNCKGVGGMVELLECLEREAIMGEDEGKEPMDYNRRAQIFDKSSQVFQALKETETTSTSI